MFSFIVKKSLSLHSLALSVNALHCHSPGCGTQHPLRALKGSLRLAGRGPNSSLFPPLAAVVAVAPKGRGF